MPPQIVALLLPAVAVLAASAWLVHIGSQYLTGARVTWWLLSPQTTEINVAKVQFAAASLTSERGNKTELLIARVADPDKGKPAVWLGIANSSNSETIAATFADALSATAELQPRPPVFETKHVKHRWVASSIAAAPAHKKGSNEPETRLDALVEPAPNEITTSYADHADQHLNNGGAVVFVCSAGALTNTLRVGVLTTHRALATSWAGGAQTTTNGWRGANLPTSWIPALAAIIATVAYVSQSNTFVGGLLAVLVAAVVFTPLTSPFLLCAPANALTLRNKTGLWKRAKRGQLVANWLLGEWGNGGQYTATRAPKRRAPDEVCEPDGALIGTDPDGREIWLPDRDRQYGVFAVGDPGAGKTTWLLSLLEADVRANVTGAHRPIFWIETKGEGARRASEVIRQAGGSPLELTAASTNTPFLSLFPHNEPERAADLLTDALRYAFSPTDIQEQSAGVLKAAFRAACATIGNSAAVHAFCGINTSTPNVARIAFNMLGGAPRSLPLDQVAGRLSSFLNEGDYKLLVRYLPPYSTPYSADNRVEAARNKLQQLLSMDGLFDPTGRKWTTYKQLLEHNQIVVINLGAETEQQSGNKHHSYAGTIAQRASAMVMFLLWDAVQRDCGEWQSQNKSVAIYSDELCDIAGLGHPDLEVIRELGDKGRSRGVLPVFATQRPGQIPPRTLDSIMSFGNRCYFKVELLETAVSAAQDLGHGAYDPAEIRTLPVGTCAARIRRDAIAMPAFTLQAKKY